MSKGILIVALVLVIVAGLLAWFVGASLDGEAHPISSAGSGSSRETEILLRSIDRRLENLEKLLEKYFTRSDLPVANGREENRGGAIPFESDKQNSNSELRAVLGQLLLAVESFRAGANSSIPGAEPSPFRRIRESYPDPNWKAWQQLWEKHGGDEEKMAADLYFLTRYDMIERFGSPPRITKQGSWEYEREASPGQIDEVSVYFEDGFIIRLSASIAGD